MKLLKIIFVPEAMVRFTNEEVDALFLASQAHYDLKCRQASEQGGVLWGIKNRLENGIADVQITWRDLDLLGKVAEHLELTHRNQPELAASIMFGPNSFGMILKILNGEYENRNAES